MYLFFACIHRDKSSKNSTSSWAFFNCKNIEWIVDCRTREQRFEMSWWTTTFIQRQCQHSIRHSVDRENTARTRRICVANNATLETESSTATTDTLYHVWGVDEQSCASAARCLSISQLFADRNVVCRAEKQFFEKHVWWLVFHHSQLWRVLWFLEHKWTIEIESGIRTRIAGWMSM